MSFMSDYEKLRLKNIEENKKVLAGLGFNKPFLSLPKKPFPNNRNKQVKRKRSEVQRPRKEQAIAANDALDQSSVTDQGKPTRRRSGRLLGKEPGDFQGLDFDLEEEEEKPTIKSQRNRENIFGAIPGIDVGTTWSTRLACSADGVHRPTVAGIHGNTEEGCYSIALSGGYEDDLDYGECFTYTGEGGRDLKGTKANPKNLRTAPQSKDQTLTRGNLALTRNVEKGRPVRVIRGYKLDSPFAPDDGYRYDGIYTVEKYWHSVGLSGFMVFKFALKRCDNQTPAVWGFEDNTNDSSSEEASENGITEKFPTNPPSKDQKMDNGNSDVTKNDAKYENGVGNEVEKENEIEEMEEEKEENGCNKEHQEEDDEVSETKELVNDDIHENGGSDANENKENEMKEIGKEEKDDSRNEEHDNEVSETKELVTNDIIHENAVSDANENKENDIEEIDKEKKDGECNEEHDNEVSETPKETEGLDNKQDE